MARTSFLTNCPRCGYIAEAWTENGVTAKVRCEMCGYEGTLPNHDLKDKPWKIRIIFTCELVRRSRSPPQRTSWNGVRTGNYSTLETAR